MELSEIVNEWLCYHLINFTQSTRYVTQFVFYYFFVSQMTNFLIVNILNKIRRSESLKCNLATGIINWGSQEKYKIWTKETYCFYQLFEKKCIMIFHLD